MSWHRLVSKKLLEGGGYLSVVIDVPSDVNWYKKDVKCSEEYDLQTFLESFFLIQESLDFANINDVTQCGENLRKLNDSQINDLATGMVVSRIFRGSIADMFNAIFTVDFALKATDSSLSNTQKLELANWWMNNKFDQSKFDSATKSQAKTLFIQKFKEVCNKLK